MNTKLPTEFRNYSPDEFCDLYKSNPDRFNELAAVALNQACIGKTQQQTIRLRQTQWFIDGQLRKAKTPLQRMQIMENIFYSRVYGGDGELKHLLYSCNELLAAVSGTARTPTRKPALCLLKNSDVS
ncbi:MAG: hypothetical protein A2X80_13385 [Geobacteraceae bacterium GWB2_52_12]|nr:MAG: hypothetical protein A2X80_13385 [Geobacteraceae bacterium GWB2_52_12]